jgi:hypothetical protein
MLPGTKAPGIVVLQREREGDEGGRRGRSTVRGSSHVNKRGYAKADYKSSNRSNSRESGEQEGGG